MKVQRQFIKTQVVLFLVAFFALSCSNDSDTIDDFLEDVIVEEDSNSDDPNTGNDSTTDCTKETAIFNESEGFLSVEFENAVFVGDWELQSQGDNFSGEGYMVWTGPQYLNAPGNGLATFKIKISTPGTYRMEWRSSVKTGDSGTEHNDTWLRFPDADDFYGEKANSIVYPNGSGKTPNPNGSSKEGWFKVYRSGNDLDFKWNTSTSDNDAHKIYVTFNETKMYEMEVSARSSGHAIDRFVLFNEQVSLANATDLEAETSSISCD